MNKQATATAEGFTTTDNRVRLHLDGPSRTFDPRAVAIRGDLVDIAAADRFFAPHYAAAVPHRCAASSTTVHGKPAETESATTQLLYGELFHVLDVRGGWAWGYCGHDHYVGYLRAEALAADCGTVPTARTVPTGALLFAWPDIKAPAMPLPGGAPLRGRGEEGDFLAVEGGWLHRRHATTIFEKDWVAVARHWLGAPYLWGGRGDGGFDCSGLVQMALAQCDIAVARDTDQQADTIGRALEEGEPLKRGDLVYFPGHVGIMSDAETLLHANAFWMTTVEEPLADVVGRLISAHAEPITARRRIEA